MSKKRDRYNGKENSEKERTRKKMSKRGKERESMESDRRT